MRERILAPFRRFAETEAAGGIVLLGATVIALAWTNSPWAGAYHALWSAPVGGARLALHFTARQLVNDGLMAAFFFVVGLEIKREVVAGELSSPRTAALPVFAAAGGMLLPALGFAALNHGGAGAAGWGVPMATDIAFALGVLTLLGDRVPTGLKLFLAALAIADDIGAVLVIAVFYSHGVARVPLAIAAGLFALLVLANVTRVRRGWIWALLGSALWAAVLASGVHATVAGVLLATTIPTEWLEALEERLHGVVSFAIMPVFALANAGVALGGAALAGALASPVALGVLVGLVAGKPAGILLFSWLAVRAGAAQLPAGVGWPMIAGAGLLGGIGFTMALFIAGLAFGGTATLDVARIAVMLASLLSGVGGYLWLRRALAAEG